MLPYLSCRSDAIALLIFFRVVELSGLLFKVISRSLYRSEARREYVEYLDALIERSDGRLYVWQIETGKTDFSCIPFMCYCIYKIVFCLAMAGSRAAFMVCEGAFPSPY